MTNGTRSLHLVVYGGVLFGGAASCAAQTSDVTAGRILEHEVTVRASLDQVWNAWTTSDGLSFLSTKNNVELRVGGPYELFLNVPPDKNGKRGGQGCKVLSFLPNEMLSFEWGFRPDIPSLRYAGAKTHVVLRFDSIGEGTTRVRLAQLGWGKGKDWDKGYDYFDKEWGEALEALRALYDKKNSSSQASGSDGTTAKEESTIKGLFQVILNVRDMSTQIAFYRDIMGLPVILPMESADLAAEDFVRLKTGGAYLVLHAGRKTRNVGDEPRLSFMVDHIAETRQRLREKGVWVDEIRSPAPGVLVADARDPEGNAFHIEAHADSLPTSRKRQ